MSVRIEGDGASVYNGVNVTTPYESEADKGVKVDDFLNLMIAQMSNQDFMNPADDTQYVTQLAQFATMQSMQELSYYSQTSYVANLVGKTVTVATLGVGGAVSKQTGLVSSVNLSGEKHTITVNGKQYELSQIMSIADTGLAVSKEELQAANNLSLVVRETQAEQIKLRWDAPNTTADDSLTYSVYYTTDQDHDMTTVDGVKKATLAADGLTSPQVDMAELTSGTTYYINVVVRNKAGNEAIYQKLAVSTD